MPMKNIFLIGLAFTAFIALILSVVATIGIYGEKPEEIDPLEERLTQIENTLATNEDGLDWLQNFHQLSLSAKDYSTLPKCTNGTMPSQMELSGYFSSISQKFEPAKLQLESCPGKVSFTKQEDIDADEHTSVYFSGSTFEIIAYTHNCLPTSKVLTFSYGDEKIEVSWCNDYNW